MTALPAPPAPPGRFLIPALRVEEVGLATLLDLCDQDDAVPSGRPHPSLREVLSRIPGEVARLRLLARCWTRRAAAWGAGPGGAWRAW
ncbi:hypothetical protein ACI8AC_19410 [Geodermatophilus sp. SYSU D00758]